MEIDYNKNSINEINSLITIAQNVGVFNDYFKYQANQLISRIDREQNNIEVNIKFFESEIRSSILKKYQDVARNQYKSPQVISKNEFNNLLSMYDRANPQENGEKILNQINDEPSDSTLIFNCGLSAIRAAIDMLGTLKIKFDKIFTYFDYFESYSLLKIACSRRCEFLVNKKEELLYNIANNIANVAFIEVPLYSSVEDELTIDNIFDAISKRKNPLVLIIDNTLNSLDLKVRDKLNESNVKLLILFVRSGLKLDQQGMEFVNLGIIDIYSNLGSTLIKTTRNVLKLARGVSGGSLHFDENLIINENVFNKESVNQHKKNIICNTKYFANKLLSLNNNNFTVEYTDNCPFICINIHNINNDYSKFSEDLSKFIFKENGNLWYGTSFGFRQTRYEIIETPFELGLKTKPFMRISPGGYLGASTEHIFSFFDKL